MSYLTCTERVLVYMDYLTHSFSYYTPCLLRRTVMSILEDEVLLELYLLLGGRVKNSLTISVTHTYIKLSMNENILYWRFEFG